MSDTIRVTVTAPGCNLEIDGNSRLAHKMICRGRKVRSIPLKDLSALVYQEQTTQYWIGLIGLPGYVFLSHLADEVAHNLQLDLEDRDWKEAEELIKQNANQYHVLVNNLDME